MYVRKTKDVYAIQSRIDDCGWCDETYEDTWMDAKKTLAEYRENCNYPVRIDKFRVPVEIANSYKFNDYVREHRP